MNSNRATNRLPDPQSYNKASITANYQPLKQNKIELDPYSSNQILREGSNNFKRKQDRKSLQLNKENSCRNYLNFHSLIQQSQPLKYCLNNYPHQFNQTKEKSTNSVSQRIQTSQRIDKPKKYAYIQIRNPYSLSQEHSNNTQIPEKLSTISQQQEGDNVYYGSSQREQKQDNKSRQEKVDFNQVEYLSKDEEIDMLRRQLREQKERFQNFQKQTIKSQMKILNTINSLELKLKQLNAENIHLRQINQQYPSSVQKQPSLEKTFYQPKHSNQYQKRCVSLQQDKNYSFHQETNQWHSLKEQLKQKQIQMEQLLKEYKKIKGVANGLVQMMKKVDKLQIPQNEDELKYAWKWIKKVVWEYQAIRKKAFQWKKAYDQLNQDSQNQDSIQSQELQT